MTNAPWDPLSRDEARKLSARLRVREPLAADDLATTYLDLIARSLARRFPRDNDDDTNMAAEDAMLEILTNPFSYDPERAGLGPFLEMAARRNLSNIWQKQKRRGQHQARLEPVELSPTLGKYLGDDSKDPAVVVELAETAGEMHGLRAERIVRGLSAVEMQVLELIEAGVSKRARYAAVLGISHLPLGEQNKQVDRVKGKVNRRRRRAGGKS